MAVYIKLVNFTSFWQKDYDWTSIYFTKSTREKEN